MYKVGDKVIVTEAAKEVHFHDNLNTMYTIKEIENNNKLIFYETNQACLVRHVIPYSGLMKELF